MEISIGLYLNSYLPCHLNIKRLRYSSNHWELGESFSNGLNKNNWPLMNEGSPLLLFFLQSYLLFHPVWFPLSKEEFRMFRFERFFVGDKLRRPKFPNLFSHEWFHGYYIIYIIYIRYNNNVSRLILKKSPFQTNTSKHTFVRLTSTVLEATVFINFFLDEIR